MKKRVLITGFEPFGEDTVNASWEAVSRLEERVGDWEVEKLLVPTVFGEAGEKVLEAARELQPDVILCVGQAGGRAMVTPEMVAINLRDASIEDNAGKKPRDEPVAPGGPVAYFASVPVRKIVESVKDGGISCGISYSAGAYVCNDLFYSLRHHFEGSGTGVGFIHVPCLPEQSGGKSSVPLEQSDSKCSVLPEQNGGQSSVPPEQSEGKCSVSPEQSDGKCSVLPEQNGGQSSVPPEQGDGKGSVLPEQGDGKGSALPEQGGSKRPGMPLEDIVQALRLAVLAL